MSLIDLSCLCMFIVFVQLTESRVLILRDDDDEPLVLGHVDRSSDEDVRHKHQASSDYKPKRFHAKKAVLQYGRHIYHLDNFKDLKELRTKMTQRKPDSISYDYFDMDDLFRVRDSAKNGAGDFIKDLVIFSNKPAQFCNGDRYDEDLRKFSKHKNDDDADWRRKKTQFVRMKRFQVVDNRHKSKTHDDASEEHHVKKKQKSTKKIKRRKKKHSSESAESMSKHSDSEEKNWGSHKKTKKKYKPPKEEKKSSEENIVKIKRKSKKKHLEDDFTDASDEKWKKHDIDTKSNEDIHKKKKNKKKINYEASNETTRKTFGVDDNFFMQGNKIFHVKDKRKKKHNDFDRRRRLEHFLPKRYHWDPSDIHDLGYYWFNGPKGTYAAPKRLN